MPSRIDGQGWKHPGNSLMCKAVEGRLYCPKIQAFCAKMYIKINFCYLLLPLFSCIIGISWVIIGIETKIFCLQEAILWNSY